MNTSTERLITFTCVFSLFSHVTSCLFVMIT